jgi:predicted aspartyl protease
MAVNVLAGHAPSGVLAATATVAFWYARQTLRAKLPATPSWFRHCRMTMRVAPRRLGGRRRMGITTVNGRLFNTGDVDRSIDVVFTVDSGAIYSVVPAQVLRAIDVEPQGRETFWLADGRKVKRDVGWALFEIEDRRAPSRVVFGRRGDACLLGMVTLEELGFSLDPLKRRLRPLRLMIA